MTTSNDYNYDFIKTFDWMRFILDTRNSIDSIFDILKNSIDEKHIRRIISNGIKQYCENCNQFTLTNIDDHINNKDAEDSCNIINKKEKHCQTDQNTNTTAIKSSNNQKTYCAKVFGIESISCDIFKYLDFKSKNKCKTVCMRWLYDLYKCASNDYLNMNDLFVLSKIDCCNNCRTYIHNGCYDIVHLKANMCNTIKDLSNFRNVRKVHLLEWQSNLHKYFQPLISQMKKVERVIIEQQWMFDKDLHTNDYEDEDASGDDDEDTHNPEVALRSWITRDKKYASLVLQLLNNNCNTIKVITLENYRELSEHNVEPYDAIDEVISGLSGIKFHKLQQLYCGAILQKMEHVSTVINILSNIDKVDDEYRYCTDITVNCPVLMQKLCNRGKTSETIRSNDSAKPNSNNINLDLSWFVQAMYKMHQNIAAKFELRVKKTEGKKISARKCMKCITAQMKHSNMIKHSIYDIIGQTDQSNYDICYRLEERLDRYSYRQKQKKYVCELKSFKIRMIAKNEMLEIEINLHDNE